MQTTANTANTTMMTDCIQHSKKNEDSYLGKKKYTQYNHSTPL